MRQEIRDVLKFLIQVFALGALALVAANFFNL